MDGREGDEAAESGRRAAWNAMAGSSSTGPAADGDATGMPAWAQAMKAQATTRHRRQVAAHTLSQGSGGGASATPDIKERED